MERPLLDHCRSRQGPPVSRSHLLPHGQYALVVLTATAAAAIGNHGRWGFRAGLAGAIDTGGRAGAAHLAAGQQVTHGRTRLTDGGRAVARLAGCGTSTSTGGAIGLAALIQSNSNLGYTLDDRRRCDRLWPASPAAATFRRDIICLNLAPADHRQQYCGGAANAPDDQGSARCSGPEFLGHAVELLGIQCCTSVRVSVRDWLCSG